MKKINVTTDSPFFRPEQFETTMLDGKELLVMKISKEEYLAESFMFSLYTNELEAVPYQHNGWERKYLCVTDSLYVVVERGEKGFDTSFHCFSADISRANDTISVNFKHVDDSELAETICDKFTEHEFSSADCFNEKHMQIAKNHNSLAQLKMIEATEFIRLPYNGNQ